MRAVVQDAYGPPELLRIEDIPTPTPAAGQVLVRVRAASLHPDVWHTITGFPYVLRLMGAGLRRPKVRVPGTDLAGDVAALGTGVTRWAVGDAVYGESITGTQWTNGGTFAEYATIDAQALAAKPAALTYDEAAAIPTAAFIALQTLVGEGQLKSGQRLLVNGAGGGVGMLAVQIAQATGAHVTAVDTAAKADLLHSLGANVVVDYAVDDFTLPPEPFDLILDVVGGRTWSDLERALTPTGRYVLVGHDQYGSATSRWFGSLGTFARLAARSPFTDHLSIAFLPRNPDRVRIISELVDAGKLRVVIDRTFPLEQVVDAVNYLATGRSIGRVVLTV